MSNCVKMGITKFEIVLDSPTGAYYAGQNVTGKLLLSLDKPKKIRAIIIKFEGMAKVSWSESETVRKNDGNTQQETVTFTADEEYFSNKYNLAGGGNSELEIPAGDHVYPFSTMLPPMLPSSFDGEHGHVHYTVKATLDRPWKFDQDTKLVFTVVTPVDLNLNVRAKEPVKQELEKTFCCCWCKSGPLTLVVAMPHSGYVPGQNIPLTIEVDNCSNVQVTGVQCKLMKVLTWKARDPKKKEREDRTEIVSLTLEGVDPNGSKSWTQQLTIPIMPPCNLDQCSIINCEYYLEVVAIVSGMHSNLSTVIPVFIGTVPVYQQPPLGGTTPVPTPVSGGGEVPPPGIDVPPPSAPTGGPDVSPVGFNIMPGPNANSMYPQIPATLIQDIQPAEPPKA